MEKHIEKNMANHNEQWDNSPVATVDTRNHDPQYQQTRTFWYHGILGHTGFQIQIVGHK